MDPASAMLAFVVTGIQVCQLVKRTLEDIRNAPKELQRLQERVGEVEMLLKELQCRQIDGVFETAEHIASLEQLLDRANACVDGIRAFGQRMQKMGRDGVLVVNKLKWLMKGDTLRNLTGELDRLDSTINAIMSLMIS